MKWNKRWCSPTWGKLLKPKKKTSSRVKGEEKIYTKYSGDAYFDKFRNKEKLKTKGEQILKKHDRK